jgi:pilus assembly protein TadC
MLDARTMPARREIVVAGGSNLATDLFAIFRIHVCVAEGNKPPRNNQHERKSVMFKRFNRFVVEGLFQMIRRRAEKMRPDSRILYIKALRYLYGFLFLILCLLVLLCLMLLAAVFGFQISLPEPFDMADAPNPASMEEVVGVVVVLALLLLTMVIMKILTSLRRELKTLLSP